MLGAFDDYLNARTGEGIRARQKLIWLTVVAFVAAWQIQQTYDITAIAVPFVGAVPIDPAVYVAFGAFAIIATANGVNLTDGLDGLSGGTLAIAFVAYMLIALLNAPLAQPNLALLCALIIGALLGFLWFNVHPAQIFIGDSGALSLGATLAVTALDHRPDPGPAADRDHLRDRDAVGHHPGRLLQAVGRQAPLPVYPDPSPLRARRLGRGEDHGPLLDRRDPRRAARRDALPGLAGPAAVMTMTTSGPIDLDRLDLDAIRAGALRDRPVTVLGLARSGLALARFLSDAGARVTVYDGRPAAALADAIAALGGRPVTLALGPDVDPAATWATADLVATSPSITPDFPTTEPRLRAALRALVEARAGGDPTVPALVSEADLFLRLCPAPTIGVTGTKGKTTTSSLTAALLAADPAHPVVLGGNIGIPIVERLLELTPAHRVVDELSELQLPTLSRGTTVAVYTNVTSDHLDRHGTLEAYRRGQAPAGRAGRSERGAGAQRRGPGRRLVRGARHGPGDPLPPRHAATGAGSGSSTAGSWPRGSSRSRSPAAAAATPRSSGRIMPVAELAIPGAHNVSNALAAIAVALAFGIDAEAIRAAAAAFTGVEHRLEPAGVIDGVRFINDSQGTQPDAVAAALRAFEPPIVLIAGGRDKGIDLAALAPVVAERAVAAVLIGESGPDARGLVPRRRPRPHRTRRRPRRCGPARGCHRPRGPGRRDPAGDRRPSCSARPPRASTCSRTTPHAGGRSRRPSPTLAAARSGGGER